MRKLSTKPFVNPVSGEYPFGRIRDKTTSTNGTPVNETVYGDIHQFFESLMDGAGVTPNGLPDNAYTGFQLYEAFLRFANNGIKTVTLSANTSETLIKSDAGKVIKVNIAATSAFTYTVTLPSATTVKAGQGYLFYIADSDTSITSVIVNGATYFNNEVVFVVSNGSTWDNVVYQVTGKTQRIVTGTEDMGSGNTRIRLKAMSSFYLLDASHSLNNVKEIKYLGDVLPRTGTKITIYFPAPANLLNDGNIRLLSGGTTGGGANHLPITGQEFREFIFDAYDDDNWYPVIPTATDLVLTGINETANVNISASQDVTVKNWINKLIALAQAAYTATLDSGWISLPMTNSCTNVSAKYRKIKNTVSLRGIVDTTTMPSSWDTGAFATLPAGYRPVQDTYVTFIAAAAFPNGSNYGLGVLRIQTDGTIRVPGFGVLSGTLQLLGTLDNITFDIS